MRDTFIHTASPADNDGPRRHGYRRAHPAGSNRPILVQVLLYLWALPTTFVGLLFVPAALVGGRIQLVDGVLELYGGVVALFLERGTLLPGGASAMTLGHVVLGRDRAALDRTRSHERVHVRQVERWGPLFLPAYVLASVIAQARGLDAYRDNPFEREAFDDDARRAREAKSHD